MAFSFLQRNCHPVTRCIKKLLTSRVIIEFIIWEGQKTNIKKGVCLCLAFIKKCCQIDGFSTSYFVLHSVTKKCNTVLPLSANFSYY